MNNSTATLDILVTRFSETGYANADWQSFTHGVGGYPVGSDLQVAIIDYLADQLGDEEQAELDRVSAELEVGGIIETDDWAYCWSETNQNWNTVTA